MHNRVLITICGRAGSSGFKNKNLKVFLGHPLVYYSLAAAEMFKEQVMDEAEVDICLNTDSEELAELVLCAYPKVWYIRRPASLGEGSVPKAAVWRHCLDYMQETESREYTHLIDLDITSPLRRKMDVIGAYRLKLERPDAEMVESVCKSRRNPFFNMVMAKDGYVSPVIRSDYTSRQQAPEIYDENASIYVLDTAFFVRQTGNMLNRCKTVPYLMKDTAVLDIDSESDFNLMQLVAQYLYDSDADYRIIHDKVR